MRTNHSCTSFVFCFSAFWKVEMAKKDRIIIAIGYAIASGYAAFAIYVGTKFYLEERKAVDEFHRLNLMMDASARAKKYVQNKHASGGYDHSEDNMPLVDFEFVKIAFMFQQDQ